MGMRTVFFCTVIALLCLGDAESRGGGGRGGGGGGRGGGRGTGGRSSKYRTYGGPIYNSGNVSGRTQSARRGLGLGAVIAVVVGLIGSLSLLYLLLWWLCEVKMVPFGAADSAVDDHEQRRRRKEAELAATLKASEAVSAV